MTSRTKRDSDPFIATRLGAELEGEVLFDSFTRGLYSTDASIYQIEPAGVVVPKTKADVFRTLEVAHEAGLSVTPRGAGTSQSGQAIGDGLVMDTSKYLTGIGELDRDAATIRVQPGVVLDRLNRELAPHGLFFPVDVATASRATLGGMAANNSAGSRSIRYGMMVDNVRRVNGSLADGTPVSFGLEVPTDGVESTLASTLSALRRREHDELERRIPKVMRRVAGYNLDRISPDGSEIVRLLVGSEGTLAFFTELELQLSPLPSKTVLGVCAFPDLESALNAVSSIMELDPSAVELVDGTLLDLARDIPTLSAAVREFVQGDPRALLIVEFAGPDGHRVSDNLDRLEELLGDLGHPDAVTRAEADDFQRRIWAVRKASMNVVMSMKADRKPVSFIEDCTVPLEHLSEYGARLEDVFRRHGTSGTWYAHASVGCLHVRPILNLKLDQDLRAMRAIAEEAHELVRGFGGSHSGEHGDGLVRSEFLEPMLGSRIVAAFNEVKSAFDPSGTLNPGKIVNPSRMDDRSLMRYRSGYGPLPVTTALDWSSWGGWAGATEMCNNNGACRKSDPGVMCPSFRATADERHTTRGRANSLRLALTGQLGADALTSPEMYDTLSLCVGCKACGKECPTGVDMARMKIEFLHHYHRRHGLPLRERLVSWLPRYAPWAARFPGLMNLGQPKGLLARVGERLLGLTARRERPRWRRDVFRGGEGTRDGVAGDGDDRPEVLLWVDTFNTYFEPENALAALRVLDAAGYRVRLPTLSGRPPCCGRTFLNAGLVDPARGEAQRLLGALSPWVERGVPIVGLEPSCLLTLRDEIPTLLPGEESASVAGASLLLDEFLLRETEAGRASLDLGPVEAQTALVHTHCHQKALGREGATEAVLRRIPGLEVHTLRSGCCGMAGAFGYEAEHYDVSMAMAELDLLPAVREAAPDSWVLAAGVSCRHQIAHGTERASLTLAQALEASLPG
jgi:FAD/FMN-containing dehydrogenase/Fe-S oxidoreductase